MPNKKKSLAETYPEVAKQWHPTRNGDLTPNDVTHGSHKKVWWKCDKGDDHEWFTNSNKMTSISSKCRVCSNKVVVKSNCISTTHPAIAKQWHTTKNGDLSPYDFTEGSNKKVWWKCDKGDDHEWTASIRGRSKGSGCAVCSNKKVVISNCLATTNPDLAKEWHSTKNGDLTPFDIAKGSDKKIWWKCDKGDDHEWIATTSNRIVGNGCSICSGRKVVLSNCLATKKPDLTQEWHTTKNGDLSPYDFTEGSNKKVWWKCDKGDDHEWMAVIGSRTQGRGCPVCSNKKVVLSNCLATTNPYLAKEWHPIKNRKLTPYDFTEGSNKKVWWKCDKGDDHEWIANIYGRSKGYGCVVCNNKKVVISNCLATTNPDLAKEWHSTKNGDLTPFDIAKGSDKKIWWKCDKGDDHEWSGVIRDREKSNCPVCGNKKVVLSNCLAITNPDLAKEWHPTKNGKSTPYGITEGSHTKAWWKCDKGDDHEWNAVIKSRNSGKDCPVCSGHKTVLSNCLATVNPDLAEQWHPSENGNLTTFEVTVNSGKKVWWKCDKGDDHEWKTVIASRNYGSGCPYCSLTPQSKQELTITFELINLFKNIDPKGLKTKLEGRLRAIDIFIPKLNLCIEFDGAYWHKDKRNIDKIKSEMLFEEGFKLIRVREEPLKKIYDTDVISKKPYNGKQVTNDILSMILSIFELETKLVSKIKAYQSKEGLQNEKGLDRYIDKILTEKAEKK